MAEDEKEIEMQIEANRQQMIELDALIGEDPENETLLEIRSQLLVFLI